MRPFIPVLRALVPTAVLAAVMAGCDMFGSDPRPTTVTLTPPAAALDAVGATRALNAEVLDEEGNVMTGQAVSWRSSDTGVASVSSAGVVTAEGNGTATVTATAGRATASATIVVSQTITSLVLISGSGQIGAAGEPLPADLVVVARDRRDNPVRGGELTFQVDEGGGSFNPATVTTSQAGGAASRWTLGPSAGDLQRARVVGGAEANPLLASAVAVPGPVAELSLLSGEAQAAPQGRPLPSPVVIRVLDRFENPVPGVAVDFTVLTGGGSFAPGNVVTDASGRAESLWTLGSPRGDQTARVTVEGTTEPLLISAEALPRPSILTPVGGDGETADAGTEVDEAPRVRVVDDEGEPIAGLTVGFAVVEGGGTVGDSLALTNEEGVATAGSWRLGNVAGPNVVVARVDELPPLSFTATGIPGPAAALERISGSAQSGAPGTGLLNPLRLRVRDAVGNGVEGVRVRFRPEPGSGVVGTTVTTSGPDGIVSTSWTLGPGGGTQLVRAVAAVPPALGEVLFVAAAVPGAPPSAFSITVRYLAPVEDEAHEIAVETAAARWASIITGDLPEVTLQVPANYFCRAGEPAIDEVIDDVIIFARIAPIDGPGRVLGSAGPCAIRIAETGGLPAIGLINLDSDDLIQIAATGRLEALVLHEMAHVLGVGSMWGLLGLRENSSLPDNAGADTHFTGPRAIAAFDALGGEDYAGLKVPVENTQGSFGTRDTHWRESVLQNELMTGFLNQGQNPLSRITTGSLQDLGYEVDDTLVDAFSVPDIPPGVTAPSPFGALDLGDDVLRLPIHVIDDRGRIQRTIPMSFR